ncbi:MAG: cardiolipin synthase [Faecousia sp.]
MGKERKPSGNSILRIVFVALSLVFQAAWLLALTIRLNAYSTALSLFTTLLSLVVVLRLNSKHTNTAMKMPWIMLILVLPVMGLSLYLLVEILGDPGVGKRLRAVREDMKDEIPANAETALRNLEKQDLAAANQARYLWNCVRWPVYENTAVTFYAEAKDAFEAMKVELEKAETFIFMEYFIVEDSSCFREIEQILVRKRAQGVEVRFLYDDIGSVGKVNMVFARRLNEEGIQCHPFNPALPVLNLFLNHRDHRKITVIDGKVGFTGGYNLAEEYFDRKHPYGKWKDTGLRLEGEAVRNLSAAFLELWGVQCRQKEDYGKYLDVLHSVRVSGFVQPFADNPLGQERAAEEVYLNLVSQANRSVYFMTPYLIITDDMNRALCLAAKRGVDVRIITPGIPDKKTVYAVTRSYYAGLACQGVRIYEYTPGFCHAKQCICDGRIASVGTSNLDYRSLYHHFENNVLLYGCDAVRDIAADFENMFPQCREVTEQYRAGRGAVLRTWQYILRLFAPLL